MGDYRKLKVWSEAHELVLEVYRVTTPFPPAERYGLAAQMRSSAASVPTNIAEGCGRDTDAELARFLRYALGSAHELAYQLLLCRDLSFISQADHERLEGEALRIQRMLAGLIMRLTPADKPKRR